MKLGAARLGRNQIRLVRALSRIPGGRRHPYTLFVAPLAATFVRSSLIPRPILRSQDPDLHLRSQHLQILRSQDSVSWPNLYLDEMLHHTLNFSPWFMGEKFSGAGPRDFGFFCF